jgi:hypothetical protein
LQSGHYHLNCGWYTVLGVIHENGHLKWPHMCGIRFRDMGHQCLNTGDFADISISKECWMLKQRVVQKTGIEWGAKITALPALMYSVLFYSSLHWLDAILSHYITCNILLECFLMRTALYWEFTQHRLAVCYQHFGTSYDSYLQGWSSPRWMLEHLGTHLYWEWFE